MKSRESSFAGEKGLRIFYRVWEPEAGPAKAVLLLFHGYAEHAGRYVALAEYLTGRGYAIYAPDHRGHGRSEGTHGLIDSNEYMVRDAGKLLELARAEHPGLPIFVLGHSVGSAIAVHFALDHQGQLAGCVLSAPAVLAGAAVNGVTKTLSRVISAVAPTVGLMDLESGVLSHDPAIQEAYDSDPLVYRGKVMARSGAEMLRLADWALEHAGQLQMPLLCMHGAADGLIDPAGSQYLYDQAACEDKTLHMFDGLYHEIFNEYEKEQIYQTVGDWLDARC